MEILEANAGLLTNFEVRRVLTEQALQKYDYDVISSEIQQTVSVMKRAEKFRAIPYTELTQRDRKDVKRAHVAKDKMPRLRQLEQACWVRKQVLSYLEGSPTVNQTEETIKAFLSRLQQFVGDVRTLSVAEVSQIIDLRPVTHVEMYRIIDDCEVRFNEEKLGELISIVECLPAGTTPANGVNDIEEVKSAEADQEEAEEQIEHAGQAMETEIVEESRKIVEDNEPDQEDLS